MNPRKTNLFFSLVWIAMLAVFGPALALAHATGGHGYQGGGPMYFDPSNMVTLSGRLTQEAGNWNVRGHGNHTGGGMDFEFETDRGEEVELMIAPAWFLEENGIFLKQGDQITITGSLIEEYDHGNHHGGAQSHAGAQSHSGGQGHDGDQGHDGGMMGDGEHPYLIATRIQADGVTLDLREDEGYPLWRGGPGWAGHRWFEPDGITTMTGTLDELQGFWSAWGQGNHTGNGMHYTFDSDTGEPFYAMLGPWWFMRGQGLTPADGKRVELRGSVVDAYWSKYKDRRFFVPTQITIGGKTALLRDDWGYPLWHGTGWHYTSPKWKTSSMTTLPGEIVKIQRKKNGRFLDKGYEVVMQSQGQNYRLFVAPVWDVKHMGLKLHIGDQVTARGSMGTDASRQKMVVQYLDAKGQRWNFRRSNGKPLWVQGDK